MGDFEADTIRDTLLSNWTYTTGRISKTTSASVHVEFVAHEQVTHLEHRDYISVRKLTPKENLLVHPNFEEVTDTFEIMCHLTVQSSQDDIWDQDELAMEDMCEEVIRILKTVYNPLTDTGAYWRTRYDWRPLNDTERMNQVIQRILVFTIWRLRGDSTSVFQGYKGTLVFDTSASTADSKPGSDHVYVETSNVEIEQGYEAMPEVIRGNSPIGVPVYARGEFGGRFEGDMFVHKSDITASTIDALDNIYKAQNNGELAKCVFLHTLYDTEPSPASFEESIPLIGIKIKKIADNEILAAYHISATVMEPTVYTVT